MPGEISRRDTAYADMFSSGSRILSKLPPLQQLVVGRTAVTHGWQRIAAPADSFDDWIKFAGDPAVPRAPIPRLYRAVGVLSVERSFISMALAVSRGTTHAVAIRLGDAVVVGPLGPKNHFAVDPQDDSRLLGGLRIGHDDVETLGGVWVSGIRSFVQAPSERYEQAATALATVDVPIV